MLMLIAAHLMFNSMTLISLVPIALDLERIYELESPLPVNMCAIIFPLMAIPMTFVAMRIYNNMTVRSVLLLATTLQVVGAWTRLLAFQINEFWPVLLGTGILATSHTLLLSSQNLVITQWFPINEVGQATAAIGMAVPLGSVTGMAVTGYLFD